jgi:hypothetical protein
MTDRVSHCGLQSPNGSIHARCIEGLLHRRGALDFAQHFRGPAAPRPFTDPARTMLTSALP